jgi:hypothetical protein
MPKQGWAKRQIENTSKNISQWPEWMRRQATTKKDDKRTSTYSSAEKSTKS